MSGKLLHKTFARCCLPPSLMIITVVLHGCTTTEDTISENGPGTNNDSSIPDGEGNGSEVSNSSSSPGADGKGGIAPETPHELMWPPALYHLEEQGREGIGGAPGGTPGAGGTGGVGSAPGFGGPGGIQCPGDMAAEMPGFGGSPLPSPGAGGSMGRPPAPVGGGMDGSWDEPNQNGALEGGEIDDNELYVDFLDYINESLGKFGNDPMVHYLEIERRHYIEVVDAKGRHVSDAEVTLVAGEKTVVGRTRADGQFAFFPLAYGDGAAEYTITAESSVGTGTGTLHQQDKVTITLDGEAKGERPVAVEIAFIIDATGSMGEEIARMKTTITQIAGRIAELAGTTELRFGLVDYRDRCEAYVTRAVDFTSNISTFQTAVNDVHASGGGDMPEELNAALHKGMRRLSWKSDTALRLMFVVADAPAHDYEDEEYVYDQAMKDASRMGVKIFPIASGGSNGIAELQFRQLAQFTQGRFIFVTKGNGSKAGSGGSDYNVDENDFQVEKLDDLIVRLVQDEVQNWIQ